MHELSIVMNILDSVEEKAAEMNATVVHKIEMEVGLLSGIEFDALDFALENAPRPPLLEKAAFVVQRIQPLARCNDCSNEFETNEYATPCPKCASIRTELICGDELRIKSFDMD
jgi:hydrogenase nickel incorporation protein HypA/HybF